MWAVLKKIRQGKEDSKSWRALKEGLSEKVTFENCSQWCKGASHARPEKRALKRKGSETLKSPSEVWALLEELVMLIKILLLAKHSISISYTDPDCFIKSVVIKYLIQVLFWVRQKVRWAVSGVWIKERSWGLLIGFYF